MSNEGGVAGASVLSIDAEAEVARIGSWMQDALSRELRKRGVVVAISGGIDSAVCAALAVKALGRSKVFGLLLPERESSPDSTTRGRELVEMLGIEHLEVDITPVLTAFGCYVERDAAIKRVIPEYGDGWRSKIAIAGSGKGQIASFRLIAESPSGERLEDRLAHRELLQVIAATSFKQRSRKTIEYFHADRLNYAVLGTPNKLEYDLGFFVRNGDGAADIKPIAHLYKTHVFAIGEFLQIPFSIQKATPSTDTYSLSQGQDEFYFGLEWQKMDKVVWAITQRLSSYETAKLLGVSKDTAQRLVEDIESKKKMSQVLRAPPKILSDKMSSRQSVDPRST
jgi:NAD+ synthase